MANNFPVLDGTGTSKTIKTTDNSTVHTPHHNLDVAAAGFSEDLGAKADAAVGDATGSLIAHTRQVAKVLTANLPAPGQGAMAASVPVAIASNQTGIPIAAGASMIGGFRDDGPFQTPSQKYVTSADMSGGVVSITDAPTSTKRIFLDHILVSTNTTMEVTLKEETSGTVLSSFFVSANTPFPWTPKNRLQNSTADKKMQAITSASGQIRITAFFHSET